MKIVAINTTTKQLVVYRGWSGPDNAEFFPITTHANGNYFYMFNASIPRWWDYVNAPHGETGTDPYSQNLNGIRVDSDFPQASHYFTRNDLTVSDYGGLSGVKVPGVICSTELSSPYGSAYGMRKAPWPNHITPDISAYGCTQGNPPFDGAYGLGSGNDLEKHPSPVDRNSDTFFDFRPYLTAPTFGDWGNPAINQTTTKVAGATYIYKTIHNQLNFGTFDEKRNRLYHMIGRRPAYDVSAAGFILPDTVSYNYTYCLTHVAGECWAGSAVGDVYTNAPNVTPVPAVDSFAGEYRCLSKQQLWILLDYFVNDICISAPINTDCVGGPGEDYCKTSAGSDGCWGGPGNDICLMGDGQDGCHGEGGNDRLYGGPGGDQLYGGDGIDRCDLEPDGGRARECEPWRRRSR